jgi:RNA 3'-terminal phosphate cyclase (ATP)
MEKDMITIDGSYGEGGGQVLRSSLALSLVTGRPFRIAKIRAGRRKSGLLRQHLTAVKAAGAVGCAAVRGAEMGSGELTFEPDGVRAGEYHFAVGTAGSATLVLQTVLPALITAEGPTRLVLEGGTHNPYAPPFDFLEKAFLPILSRMGPVVTAELERHGFYPAGGGRFVVEVAPVPALSRLDLMERGEILRQEAVALVSQLPRRVGDRELAALKDKLSWDDGAFDVQQVANPRGPGNVLMVTVASEHVTEVFTGFGERGVLSEQVAGAVVKPVREYLASGVPVGRYLADQLLLPMALAGGGEFMTLPLSRHATTNIEILKQFLDVDITVTRVDRPRWHVKIESE